MSNIIDLEKHGDQTSSRTPSVDKDYGVSSATPAVPGEVGEVVVIHRGKYLQKCVDFMNRMGGEERGIERVLPYEKTDQKPFDNFSVWMSANLTVSTFALGSLGPGLFYMGWWDSFVTILFFNLLGIVAPSYMATFGPLTGLRTITFTRYSFGWYGAMFLACINIISCIGWSMVNSIAGGQIIYSISDGKCPLAVSVILIALVSLLVALFGYKVIHLYERYSWLLMITMFTFVAGFGGHAFVNLPMPSGSAEMASVLSFGAAVFGFSIAWCSLTMDYNVNMKAETGKWPTFSWTYLGFFCALNLLEWLGAAAMTATFVDQNWANAYTNAGIGGLLWMCVEPSGGFGKFVLALLAFSIVANNVPNNYSLGLCAQVLGNWAIKVPRFIWTSIGVLVYVIAAVAGRNHFATILDSFLLCMGYWVTPYALVVFMEHHLFARGRYNLDTWNDKRGLPLGLAAFTAWACSLIMAVMGMSQVWYVGPLAILAGGPPYGADIGIELSIGTCLLLYPPLRYIEKKKFGI